MADQAAAVDLLTTAAAGRSEAAMLVLHHMYKIGIVAPLDAEKAAHYLELAEQRKRRRGA